MNGEGLAYGAVEGADGWCGHWPGRPDRRRPDEDDSVLRLQLPAHRTTAGPAVIDTGLGARFLDYGVDVYHLPFPGLGTITRQGNAYRRAKLGD